MYFTSLAASLHELPNRVNQVRTRALGVVDDDISSTYNSDRLVEICDGLIEQPGYPSDIAQLSLTMANIASEILILVNPFIPPRVELEDSAS